MQGGFRRLLRLKSKNMPTGIYKRKPRSEEYRKNLRIAAKKRGVSIVTRIAHKKALTGRKLPPHSKEWNEKIKQAHLKIRYKTSEREKGNKHWNWQGGIYSEIARLRKTIQYYDWRDAVYKRDKYTCIECKKSGVYLNAHHKKSFRHFPELRFDINNGITLCVPCHKKIDKNWGKRGRNIDKSVHKMDIATCATVGSHSTH